MNKIKCEDCNELVNGKSGGAVLTSGDFVCTSCLNLDPVKPAKVHEEVMKYYINSLYEQKEWN